MLIVTCLEDDMALAAEVQDAAVSAEQADQ
jgi:hypothetical protein